MNRWLRPAVGPALVLAGWMLGAGAASQARAGRLEGKMVAHMVFFTLNDPSEANVKKMIDACKKYLVEHPGVKYFAVGPRVPDLNREVNDKNFHIGLHLVFADKAAHDKYQDAPMHQEFIKENKELWKEVKVFDSYLEATEVRD